MQCVDNVRKNYELVQNEVDQLARQMQPQRVIIILVWSALRFHPLHGADDQLDELLLEYGTALWSHALLLILQDRKSVTLGRYTDFRFTKPTYVLR